MTCAHPVAETVVTPEAPLPACAKVPLSVTVPAVSEAVTYAVRTYIECNGSGDIRGGDLTSTRSYPVLSRGHAGQVEVEVQAI